MHNLPVAVLGASGYAGRELCALVGAHPRLQLRHAAAQSQAGETVRVGRDMVTFCAADAVDFRGIALAFTALPHGAGGEWVARAQAAGARVVDLANDLRPGTGAASLLPSGALHAPAGVPGVPYGLTELTRAQVAGAGLVANPGCYPTAILLALLPFLEQGLVAPDGTITIAAASGVTGAGLTPRADLLYGEVTENYRAYGVGNAHKHLDELRAVVTDLGCPADVVFTPHLLPVARGILATITLPLATDVPDPLALLRARWAGEPFVEVADAPPALRDVAHRNVVRVHAARAAGTRRPTLVLVAAIDNLVKGAAGQAVQNANLMLGLPEAEGLPA